MVTTISQKMENDAFQIKFQTGIKRNHRQNVIRYYLLRRVDNLAASCPFSGQVFHANILLRPAGQEILMFASLTLTQTLKPEVTNLSRITSVFFSSTLLKIWNILQCQQVHGAPPNSPLNSLLMVPVGVMITGSLKMDCGLMF